MVKTHFFVTLLLFLVLGFFITAHGQNTTSPPQTEEDKIYKSSEVDKNAVILQRQRPGTDGRCRGETFGRVVYEIILRRSGQVEISRVIWSSNCETFNRNAYQVTKAMKFEPAVKDGRAVSVKVRIEHTFTT
jgi:TonB family protein